MNDDLIDMVYEAGAMPERWPGVLERLSQTVGCRGGTLFSPSSRSSTFVFSERLDGVMAEFFAGGWAQHNPSRISERMIAEPLPTFFTDLDCHTVDEMDRLPIYTDFLRPRGIDAAAGTIVRAPDGGRIALTLEGFGSHADASASVAWLNGLRPHLARAVTLSARVAADRLNVAMQTLATVGMPAAMVGEGGRLLAANVAFDGLVDRFGIDGTQRFQLRHAGADALLVSALAARAAGHGGRTIPIGPVGGGGPAALHLIPIEGAARDLFAAGATLLILAQGTPAPADRGAFLETLFDLTVAEARLATALLGGAGLPDIARRFGVSVETVRTQLKALFGKTGVKRQIDLVRLFDRLAPPGGVSLPDDAGG